MSILSGLFGPDTCSICGNKLGILGNQDILDGVMCKECTDTVSPYLTDLKNIPVSQMQEHISYRIDNQNNLLGFKETRHLNMADTPIYVDENNQCMLICDRRFYTPDTFMQENPDVIWNDTITGVRCRLLERRTTQYGDRPDYLYNFQVEIYVNSSWIQLITFTANAKPIEVIETNRMKTAYAQIKDVLDYFKGLGISVQFTDESTIGLEHLLTGQLPAPLIHPERPIGPAPMERGAAYGAVHEMHRPEPHPTTRPRPMEQPRPMTGSRPMEQPRPMTGSRPMEQPNAMNHSRTMDRSRQVGQPGMMNRPGTMEHQNLMGQRENNMGPEMNQTGPENRSMNTRSEMNRIGGDRRNNMESSMSQRSNSYPSGGMRSGESSTRPSGGMRSGESSTRPSGGMRSGESSTRPSGGMRSGESSTRPTGGMRSGNSSTRPSGGTNSTSSGNKMNQNRSGSTNQSMKGRGKR